MLEHELKPLISQRFLTEERYRNGHIRIINPLQGRKILGLHLPDMKAFAKDLCSKGCAIETIKALESIQSASYEDTGLLYYEEVMIWGFLINGIKCSPEERAGLLEGFIPAIDNWAICDSFCSSAKWMARYDKAALWSMLERYYDSDKEFEVRFAIVASMCYLLVPEWIDKVFSRISAIDYDRISSRYVKSSSKGTPGTVAGNPPYYVRMAAAWLMATALAKDCERTRAFARECSEKGLVPPDVIRLYVRKARESFRTRHTDAM